MINNIFRAFETLDARNITDHADLLIYADDVAGGILLPGILFTFFMITLLGGFFSQQRATGRSDFAVWFVVAAWSTTILSFVMALKDNLVSPTVHIILIALSVLGIMFLWLGSGD